MGVEVGGGRQAVTPPERGPRLLWGAGALWGGPAGGTEGAVEALMLFLRRGGPTPYLFGGGTQSCWRG